MLHSILVCMEIEKPAGHLVWNLSYTTKSIINVIKESIFCTLVGFEYLQYMIARNHGCFDQNEEELKMI